MTLARTLLTLSVFVSSCNSAPSPLTGPVAEGEAGNEVGDRLCDVWGECRCGELAGVSLANCSTGLRFSWMATTEDARANGWTYDGDCLTRRINAMQERGCAVAEGVALGCGDESCLIYYGTVAEGGECEGGFSQSDCQQGLTCLGTCQVPCSGPSAGPLDEGEPCLDMGTFLGVCQVGLLCDPDSELCTALPGEGSACLLNQCAEGLYCDTFTGAATCARVASPGTECVIGPQCDSAICEGGSCAPLPTAGQPCAGLCADDLACVRDAAGMLTCVELPGLGSACLADPINRCAEGLACAGDVCVSPPGDGEACLDPTSGATVLCAGDLICGARLCMTAPDTPGCEDCVDSTCVARICMPVPPAVCADSGGLLF